MIEMNVISQNKCTGCGACAEACPVKAIEFKENEEGFLFPFIRTDICLSCKKCKLICPINNEINKNSVKHERVYSFINSDKNVLLNSSSGGVFYALSKYIINNGGCVFGAVYDDKKVIISKAETIDELVEMQGSKYVECISHSAYKLAERELLNGRLVLFTGLPCQIAGLYAYLGAKEEENLFTMEVLCHGVPSGKLFSSYIDYLTNKYGNICRYSFREKKKWGWGNWGSFDYINSKGKCKRKFFTVASDYYYSLYFKENCYRESCYRCKFASIPRIADITVGDFWGIKEKYNRIKNGVSIVITNNKKGEKIFKKIEMNETRRYNIEDVIPLNKTINENTVRPKTRNTLYKDINKFGFEKASAKYVKLKKVTSILKRYIVKYVKKILY